MKKYLIIGNGIAAVGCIEGIRSADHDGEITVVSAEDRPAYYRPLISYYLEGRTTHEMMRARDEDFYERNGCKVIYSKKAVGTDTAKKQVKLSDGSVLSYDVLCFATGSSPFVTDMEGLDKVKNKHTFLTLDDALDLEKSINGNSKVLIIGAGLIGLKCAEGIRSRVSEITVCDLASRVLSSILDSDCSDVVKEHLEKNGISFLLGDSAERFDDGIAYMKSGCEIGFDTLVLAVGVRANVSLFRDAGGETGRGIITDERMRTSLDGIYAAGDCTESLDITSGKRKVIAILPSAYMQGHAAGVNMAGGDEVFDKNMPMNSIGFFGMHIMTAGTYDGDMSEERSDTSLKRFFTKDGYLVGFEIIGAEERAGIYTSVIRERTPLSSLDFELLKSTAGSAAFSKEKRKKMFGGAV